MGVLDTLFDRLESERDVCKFSKAHYEVTYTVSPESHEVAYAVAIEEPELEALAGLVAAEREGEASIADDESLETALETALDDETFDVTAVAERVQRPRRTAEVVLETWRDLVVDDVDVVYLPIGVAPDLAAYVSICRERAEDEDDPFELPDDFERVTSLLVRCKRATERDENRVVVNTRQLPTIDR